MKQSGLGLTSAILILVCFLHGSCTREKPAETAQEPPFYANKDLIGRQVVLQSPPRRLISLAPSNTEIVFALGAGLNLEGVTRFCDYPAEAKKIERVGDLVTVNYEQIIRLSPDLVLAGNKILPETISILEKTGIVVAVTEATSIAQVYQSITEIGLMTGKQNEAQALCTCLKNRVDEILAATSGLARPRCYYIVSFGDYGNWTCGPGSFLHEMITLAGGENVGALLGKPWGLFSLETLVILDPEILFAGRYSGPIESLAQAPGYRSLAAVKQGRVIILDDDLTGRPGPRFVLGLEEMAIALHPKAFAGEKNP